MPVSTSTNDKLRELMASAQAHRSACNVSADALSVRHAETPAQAQDRPRKGFLSNAKAAFAGLMEAFSDVKAPASAADRQEIVNEVISIGQRSYYDMMSALNIDWSNPVYPDDPYFTYAHKAARLGLLPDHFAHWELRDRTGATVAHIAAEMGHLPTSFDKWGITRGDGWSVAHEAALSGHLPPDIDPAILEWTDVYGKTVRQALADHERFSQAHNSHNPRMN